MLLTIKMPQNYQFIDNPLNCDRTTNAHRGFRALLPHVIEQLNHINALLVDQLVENQQFVESLLQLREHYQTPHSHINKSSSCQGADRHVNALLADQAVYSIENTSLSLSKQLP